MIRELTGTLLTPAGANILGNVGATRLEMGDIQGALDACREGKMIHERAGTLQTPGGRLVLKHLGSIEERQRMQR